MKWKRWLILTLVCSLFGGATVLADTMGLYKGFTKVTVLLNGERISEESAPPILVDGKTYVPLSSLVESSALESIIKWDDKTKTVRLYKPNVDMFLFEVVNGKITTPFGKVSKGSYQFVIFSQVDNLKTDIHSLKLTVEDPNGKVLYPYEEVFEESKDNFWLVTPTIHLNFDQTGDYKIKMYMKPDAESSYVLIDEKLLISE